MVCKDAQLQITRLGAKHAFELVTIKDDNKLLDLNAIDQKAFL